MRFLSKKEFIEFFKKAGGKKHWYGYPRAFVLDNEVYINQNAFFLGRRDYTLLLAHEQGHLQGKEHTWFGIMSPWGLVRYLTSPRG